MKIVKIIIAFFIIKIFCSFSFATEIIPCYGGVYQISIKSPPVTLDPAKAISESEQIICMNLYDRLLQFDSTGNIVPCLAESYTISSDSLTFIFKLKKNVLFHNGRELTAYDVKFSFERLLDPNIDSPFSWYFKALLGSQAFIEGKSKEVAGLIALDSYSLQISLSEPDAYFLIKLATLPASIVPKEEVYKLVVEQPNFHPIGSGPFQFYKYIKDEKVILVYNPLYWEGRPFLDKLEFIIINNDKEQKLEFELKNLEEYRPPVSEYLYFSSNTLYNHYLFETEKLQVHYLGCNLTKEPLNHLSIRELLNYAIDRKSICVNFLNNKATELLGLISTEESTSKEFYSLKTTFLSLNKNINLSKRAINLFIVDNYELISRIATKIQKDLIENGIVLDIQKLPEYEFYRTISAGDYELFYNIYSLPAKTYPDFFLFSMFLAKNYGAIGNQTYYYHRELEKLLDKLHKSFEQSMRKEILSYLEKNLIIKDLPYIFLFTTKEYVVYQPYVHGIDCLAINQRIMKNVFLEEFKTDY